jgi:hypothetical protein
MASPTLHFEKKRGGTRNQAGQRRQVPPAALAPTNHDKGNTQGKTPAMAKPTVVANSITTHDPNQIDRTGRAGAGARITKPLRQP